MDIHNYVSLTERFAALSLEEELASFNYTYETHQRYWKLMSHDKLRGVFKNLWLRMYTHVSRWIARDSYAIKIFKQNEAQSAPAQSTQTGVN